MPFVVQDEIRKDEEVLETSVELVNKMAKEAEVPQKLVPIPRPPPPFSQKLVKKTEDDMVKKKRSVGFEDDDRMQHCSDFATRCLVQKKEDSGVFTIPCSIGLLHFAKTLCNLDASINLMPLSIYKKLGLGDPKCTVMRLLMADRTIKKLIEILHDVLVKVKLFIFSADFVILD
ncbi:uncharacterized protein LOC107027442 [Solanum pennellii]|uniref:Uncharacterized protein LOC107027442 n=1 Tax=Solanum pennellii TaxID=28526 RepID=A0ABM1HDY3_SOLPN|nr:uncharacterized protein LOC107027442 [Solanum pennellii]